MRKLTRTALPLLALCAVTILGCLLCYQYDNKYTAPRLQMSSGVAVIDEQALAKHPVVMLVDGWEVYGGRLLAPEDFDGIGRPTPDQIIYIGQYGGFEALTPDGSPHGGATYRLTLNLPEIPRSYTLELPEIFSAYRAYVNGTLLAQMGDPDPISYHPETRNTSITFEASGKTEIVIAVSDYSHLYSGLVYPPAFGLSDAVLRLLSLRLLFRALLTATALTIGLLSVLIGVLSRRIRPALLYGLLCLFFVGYTAYPLIKTFFSGYYPFYAFENFSFCAMLLTAGVLLCGASGIKGRRTFLFPLLGSLACAMSVVTHLLLARGKQNLLPVMQTYSYLITAFEWITAGYLTFLSALSLRKRADHSKPILAGIIVFDAALVMDRVLPLHEPIITGWFPELAGFVLILCIGVAVGAEIAEQYKNSAVQNERAQNMEHLLRTRQSYYALLDEKTEHTMALHHDLRHHVSMLDGLIASKQYAELSTYLLGFKQNMETAAIEEYSKNHVINVLANHYSGLAARQDTKFQLRCDLESEINIADADFSSLLCNLMENALEACARMESGERYVRVGISRTGSILNIRVENSANASRTAAAGGNRFASSKAEGRTGYGLYSISMIAKKYNGQSNTVWQEDNNVFVHHVTLVVT